MAKYPPEPLSFEEVRNLILACSRRWPTGCRNRALIVLLYRSGLRCAEALALRPWDLDADAGTIRVMCGKGGKSRVVGMDGEAFRIIGEWAERREQILDDLGMRGDRRTKVPLFCALKGLPLYTSYVRSMVKRMGRRAGIAKRCHPHGLRHTMAVELRVEGVDIGIISKQLGHATIATSSRYLDHIMPTAVVETMAARSFSLT